MPGGEVNYLQLLREQIGLFGQLAEVRSEKNSLRDLKLRLWDERRPELSSNAQFEVLWRSTASGEREHDLGKKEREILSQIEKMETLVEHFRFAGLDDAAA